jgi:hypothetical protein
MDSKERPAKGRKSESRYVALDPRSGRRIVASGSDVGAVIDRARKSGVDIPALLFVPKEGVTYIY